MRKTRLAVLGLILTGCCLILPAQDYKKSNSGTGVIATSDYAPDMVERYLSKNKAEYIRPGLNIAVESIEIPGDLRPEVVISITDDKGQPLDREGKVTPGAVSPSFILAWYDGAARQYTAYTTRTATSSITGNSAEQASSDSGGQWTTLALGRYHYKFGTALPANYDGSKTHTLAMYATRSTSDLVGKNYYSNVLQDFRPDGEQVTEIWDAMPTDTCNTCHDPLAIHGGSRRDVKLCVTCHNPQSTDPDTGNTVDMKVMIHKIHMGEELPSVQAGNPYQIIGFRNSVHDYSTVAFPQDNRNCVSCHPETSSEAHIWYTRPTRAACGSCHDNIDWITGEGHRPGPALDDSECANCHAAEGEREFDKSIMGAHVIPEKSQQLAGLNVSIMDIANTGPGENPSITFKVTDNSGVSLAPADLDRLRFLVGGPNTEYSESFREDALTAEFDGDIATYTFDTPIPAHATGSWSVTADVYRNVEIQGSEEGETISVREAAFNPFKDFAVTDAAPNMRREIVSINKCNDCHDQLALHGGQRFAIEECVMCHTPEGTDAIVRPEDDGPAESIHFKYMIHKIHKGEELARDFTVYGFRSSVHNYNELLYPGDLRNCETCHLPGTYGVPTPVEARATITDRDWYSPMLAAAGACLSCHDSEDAAAHAFVNTAPFGESCAACHGENREFSVSKVHAR